MAGKLGPNSEAANDLDEVGVPDDDWPFELASVFLKAALLDIQKPARAPTPAEAEGLEMMRGLVRIGREVSAKQSGQPHDEMIADNAELLASLHIAKYQAAARPVSIPEQLYTSVSVPVPTAPHQPTGSPRPEPVTWLSLTRRRPARATD
ncbi:hypothetical protein ACFOVS_18340 [Rhizobium lemnae]|uniref:Uncharacterized protein n=1 Tax=Rhizobium lemnae TaxID=1214924 RepID=A0ABV8EDV9_9HYPH